MKKLLIIFVTIALLGCKHSEKETGEQWKSIEVGDYIFDFPPDFELIKEQGIDSYAGKIKGDSISFNFDFGYYSSDLEETSQEYLNSGIWMQELPNPLMKKGVEYTSANLPKVDVLNIFPATSADSAIGKGCDYVAKCEHNKTKFDFAIYIPERIKELNFQIDTINNQYRRIVWPKDLQKGITGIYLCDLNDFSKSMNSYLGLSMMTSGLTFEENKTVLKIFETWRHKNKKQ